MEKDSMYSISFLLQADDPTVGGYPITFTNVSGVNAPPDETRILIGRNNVETSEPLTVMALFNHLHYRGNHTDILNMDIVGFLNLSRHKKYPVLLGRTMSHKDAVVFDTAPLSTVSIEVYNEGKLGDKDWGVLIASFEFRYVAAVSNWVPASLYMDKATLSNRSGIGGVCAILMDSYLSGMINDAVVVDK